MSLNQNNEILDVVIIGGGLVGGLTALLLAQSGVQPTVLDAAPILDADKTLGVANPRVLALSQATIHLLKIVGVWLPDSAPKHVDSPHLMPYLHLKLGQRLKL